MPLDSDISNADAHLHVEFYLNEQTDYKGAEFIRIIVPGDKTNIVEQPVRDDHKERFPRQYLFWKMKNNDASAIGTPLNQWHKDNPDEFGSNQMAELEIMKFQTVEQVATATDAQLQKIGMGAVGLRERARHYIAKKNRNDSAGELEDTRNQLKALQAQMNALMQTKKMGRPRKEA